MRVLVAISYFNSEDYLHDAILSILNQSFKNFEFWLFNDCSTDSSEKTAKSFKDKRIKHFKNKKNLGLTKTLNFIIKKSNHDILIRMDADDISHKNRIENLVKVMSDDKDIGLSCSSRKILDSNRIYNQGLPKNLRRGFAKKNWIAHPTVALNLNILKKKKLNYNTKIKYAQDYELWCRMILKNIKFHHINKPLLFYRQHENQIANKKRLNQLYYTFLIKLIFNLRLYGKN